MSIIKDYDSWYWDNAADFAEAFQDTPCGRSAYECFADENPKWKAFSSNNDELLEAFLDWLEDVDCDYHDEWENYIVGEFHTMLSNRAEAMADEEYQRRKEGFYE